MQRIAAAALRSAPASDVMVSAEDIAQDTMATLHQRGHPATTANLLAWTIGIAKLKLKEARRRAHTQVPQVSLSHGDPIGPGDAEDQAIGVMHYVWLLDHLAPVDRMIVEWRQAGFSSREIAQELQRIGYPQMTANNVDQRFYRALKALRACVFRREDSVIRRQLVALSPVAKDHSAMTTQPDPSGEDRKIVPLFAEEQSASTALSRYWDAAVRGQPLDAEDVDPELKTIVQLLRYYHAVTRPSRCASVSRCPRVRGALPPSHPGASGSASRRGGPPFHHPKTRAMLMMVSVFVIIFVGNTLVSPRSWLLSSSADPDWIPWVSDDWLGASALTAHSFVIQPAKLAKRQEGNVDGA